MFPCSMRQMKQFASRDTFFAPWKDEFNVLRTIPIQFVPPEAFTKVCFIRDIFVPFERGNCVSPLNPAFVRLPRWASWIAKDCRYTVPTFEGDKTVLYKADLNPLMHQMLVYHWQEARWSMHYCCGGIGVGGWMDGGIIDESLMGQDYRWITLIPYRRSSRTTSSVDFD